MFEAAELRQVIAKADYDRIVAELRGDLLEAQTRLRAANFSVILVIGGVDGAGKSETVNTLLEWLDPRFVQTFALATPSDEERERPRMWRFWRALPPRGRIGIFFGGWHTAPIVDRVYRRIKAAEMERQLAGVNAFERMLVDDGALIVKLWMHLSKKEQKRRLRTLSNDPRTRWRVSDIEWEHFARYDRFRKVSAEALRRTSTPEAPWTIVEATDPRFQKVTVGRVLLAQLRARLAVVSTPAVSVPAAPPLASGDRTILNTLDLTKRLDKEEYEQRLEACQGALNRAAHKAAASRRSTVVVMEGVDAAGKGSAIRRITGALDARMYQIIPIAAPTEEELLHPYLWRFWKHLPRAGRLVIFDRSWYGRVLVERVEELCEPAAWQRAYTEINAFEEQLVAHGIVVVKLWLHISQGEQLRRFEDRRATPWKQFKLTPEDWRNREKWPQYERAVNDMVDRTSTEIAPWTLVESEDKRYARIKVLETVRAAMRAHR